MEGVNPKGMNSNKEKRSSMNPLLDTLIPLPIGRRVFKGIPELGQELRKCIRGYQKGIEKGIRGYWDELVFSLTLDGFLD